MADETGANPQPALVAAPPTAATDASAPAAEAHKEVAPAEETKTPSSEAPKEIAPPAAEAAKAAEAVSEPTSDKPASKPDVNTKTAADEAAPASSAAAGDAVPAAAQQEDATATPVADKSKSRRKSAGGADNKGQKLKKKASKARITHIDAQPGDHFFVKLKGYPPWPAIICDEAMLPQTLLRSRPVTAKRADGTYRVDFADGGKKVGDRTFPVMYLHTNEFGWVPNVDLHDLDPDTVASLISDKMRKDLQQAHLLAAEAHPLDHYKDVLQQFQEELEQVEQAKKEAKLAAETTPAKKSKKSKSVAADEDGDVDMADAADDDSSVPEKSSKKRKAEEDTATPQRSDSVKKPKIKIKSSGTPNIANGVSTPKSAKSVESKPTKTKKKEAKATEDKKAEKETPVPKEPELSQEEKHQRKEKEVLFLRHKLQKGLLTRDQEPKVEEMKMMSDYVTKLEAFPDLEVSIIRATKINKVLKAILKLESIPKEEEFQFKPRSQVLLDKWNKLLSVDGGAPVAAPAAVANGVNGKAGDAAGNLESAPKAEKVEASNGVEESGEAAKEVLSAETVEEPAAAALPKAAAPAPEAAPEAVEAAS